MTARVWPAVLLALFGAGCFAHQYRSNPRVGVVEEDPIVQMMPASKVKNVFDPKLVPADRQTDPPEPLERVLGLTAGPEPRAYPIGLLDRFEVVNDHGAGLPYLVSRCALTGVAAVYDRRVRGRPLLFENSGALWRDTLVLRDRETGTYWSAATGAALAGALAGEKLRPIPALFAHAVDWGRAFPRSLYLDLGKSTSVPLPLVLYGVSPWQGVSGEKTEDRRHEPKQLVFVVAQGDEAAAYTSEEIEKAQRIETRMGDSTVRIEWDSRLQVPRAYDAGPGGKERAIVPMYWFAVGRHFHRVRTLEEPNPAARHPDQSRRCQRGTIGFVQTAGGWIPATSSASRVAASRAAATCQRALSSERFSSIGKGSP